MRRRHNNTCFDHYWANWDLANMATILAIGVLADDRAKFKEAVDYFKNGSGTGQVDRLVRHVYQGDRAGRFLGQGQEAGRDQGHAVLCISLIGAFCKIAFDQGEDLFAYKDNKVLALAEYTAKYNLGESVPWTDYTNCENFRMTAISDAGRGNVRPAWELLYNHYAKRKGFYAPYTQRFAEQLRPEGGGGHYGTSSGGFDQLGFGTLMFTEDQSTTGLADDALAPPRRAAAYSMVLGNAIGLFREVGEAPPWRSTTPGAGSIPLPGGAWSAGVPFEAENPRPCHDDRSGRPEGMRRSVGFCSPVQCSPIRPGAGWQPPRFSDF